MGQLNPSSWALIRDDYTEQWCLFLFLFLFHDCSHVGVGVVGVVGVGGGGGGGGGGVGVAVNKKEVVVEEKSPFQILLL